MKKLLIVCLFMVSAASFAQQTAPSDTLQPTAAVVLHKSREQRTGAIVLTIVGSTGLLLTLTADIGRETVGQLINMFTRTQPDYKSLAVPYLLSTAALGGGIYLFTAAGKNKRKAHSLSTGIRMEKLRLPGPGGMITLSYPALTARIPIR